MAAASDFPSPLRIPRSAALLLILCLCSALKLCNGYFYTINRHTFGHPHHPHFASHNYRDALTKSILFFEGQRSGRLPSSQRLRWRRDSGLSDGSAANVFQFADMYRGPYSNGLKKVVCPFYCSYSGYEDELLWGAAWLFKATRNPIFLKYIQINGQTLGAGEYDNTFGWDNKHVGARILLSKAFLVHKLQSLHDYKGRADNFICSVIPDASFSSTQFTPGGLLFKMRDDNMQYVTSTSFLLLTYAKYLTSADRVVNCGGAIITPTRLRSIAKQQVDYLLGDNPLKMSYMVGYGPLYPQRIHHRGSSLPSVAAHPAKIQCSAGFDFMKSSAPNPNILVGAVVGGPDKDDRFPDQRPDYEQSEPTTYINAPLVGALAYLAHSFGQL
ncbi:hypothetical protein SAY86_002110 [Trapa natans]|uniref:Endoglucanase n=1 Tax=Trapa natans TaxID=22666 RepID=A0AAN7LRS2_TRANT|nr:hypothetical protein SAY86_002110 [Trapa natans]